MTAARKEDAMLCAHTLTTDCWLNARYGLRSPDAAQRVAVRCRAGAVTNTVSATVPVQRSSTSCCIAPGKQLCRGHDHRVALGRQRDIEAARLRQQPRVIRLHGVGVDRT